MRQVVSPKPSDRSIIAYGLIGTRSLFIVLFEGDPAFTPEVALKSLVNRLFTSGAF
jgi:hypothetical protein